MLHNKIFRMQKRAMICIDSQIDTRDHEYMLLDMLTVSFTLTEMLIDVKIAIFYPT